MDDKKGPALVHALSEVKRLHENWSIAVQVMTYSVTFRRNGDQQLQRVFFILLINWLGFSNNLGE